MVKVVHYRDKCIGCNACVEADPGRWRMSRKDGKSTLVGGTEKNGIYMTTAGDDEYQSIRIAAQNCPVKIIKTEKIQ
ncbi:MAG: ferredoxin [Bacteroidetes bacterium]|nr:ferredoxin [Bacteroidota bacterium]